MKTNQINSFQDIDHLFHAVQGHFTLNISPVAVSLAVLDWAFHIMNSPGKQSEMVTESIKGFFECAGELISINGETEPPDDSVAPKNGDIRFKGLKWHQQPFKTYRISFSAVEKWWRKATTDISGVTPHHQNLVSFLGRQLLDMAAPSNFLPTNPEVLKKTIDTGGANLYTGFQNYLEDVARTINNTNRNGTAKFVVGENLAATRGKIVYRNRLIELIQYSPSTETVFREPVLIVPAWIMKYYILDLSPHNSLVKYLVDKGHTVFMISWKNPVAEDRELGMDDYSELGVKSAINAVNRIVPDTKIHAVGYCLGGTLLTITAAEMSGNRDDRLKTMSLLATQTDFTEAGDLTLFIDDAQVSYLEGIMARQNYLDSKQMTGAFQLLRSNDLIWSQVIQNYLMGTRPEINDLMAWNKDATRMPYRMHSQYLRRLFLNNDLFEGRYRNNGKAIVISDIHVPVFLVATSKDHVAPWESVYKFNLSSDAESVTFVLTNGGHNAGIISEPDHPRRYYQLSCREEGEKYIDHEVWKKTTPVRKGSWWIPWQKWLAENSGERVQPPEIKNLLESGSLYDAPGTYVMQK